MSKPQKVKVTLNKQVMLQHLIVKMHMDPKIAGEVIDLLTQLQHDTLMREGKVIWKNIGTLAMKIAPAKVITSFGEKRKVPTRYKLKFTQSHNFTVTRSPLKALSVQDELKMLSNLNFED